MENPGVNRELPCNSRRLEERYYFTTALRRAERHSNVTAQITVSPYFGPSGAQLSRYVLTHGEGKQQTKAHAMELRAPLPALMRTPNPGQSDRALERSDMEIDLDRVVYDPAYRRQVRDQLNRVARRNPADRG
jgi:hypothetical protein